MKKFRCLKTYCLTSNDTTITKLTRHHNIVNQKPLILLIDIYKKRRKKEKDQE
jgi:hypothetical protein